MRTPAQVAKIAHVHPNTIRLWATEYADFLTPAARGETGPRLFSDEDTEILRSVATLRATGMPPAEIVERLRQQDAPSIIDVTTGSTTGPQSHTDGLQAPQMALQVQSSLMARLDALERTQTTLLRAATLWGALLGAIVALAGAAFVILLLYLLG